ncbi:uncharacterized protein RAG0_15953 [Rhynchosporium agropyri]|uniref:Uncharacterized protein n=1 Tax=Rhynchosporium agropyri TaxID=914238 RepID=A0A1E1LN61_9HELO|nr:uncharacterized protein RAG0_15953 [Rhynchosporium agropyri]
MKKHPDTANIAEGRAYGNLHEYERERKRVFMTSVHTSVFLTSDYISAGHGSSSKPRKDPFFLLASGLSH